ncbi:MAG: prepilin-type N-terminal cleavage/methylation domain-containing protein [Lachnospiraceae bacterium]|nr:prepilin-type N-terminal cleavage/methylation domain-containing protein [Lachnospiraceae bacterium]
MNDKISSPKTDKGFTLVELIVVLVILAVLAAILVPTLIGYIEQARSKKDLENARTCMEAAQAKFSEQYGLNSETVTGTPVVSGAKSVSTSGNADQDITNTTFASETLELAGLTGDMKPYFFMVAVGSNAPVKGTYTVTEADKYTVYYAAYIQTKDSKPWFYYNNEWTTLNPHFPGNETFDGNNIVKKGALKGKRMQYYLISNQTPYQGSIGTADIWNWLKKLE